ncbi:sialidase [Trypanosoma conorhini]|uniref:Sialidase n=1 Tax=Trypanosoma conorhini TaxID=83891 RepID=A0A3R7KTW2_9TRYP|nr:sialidase [Trypanosoma conorhini]RNF01280.1 sialidase [Trypanosoma conorhini]
MKRNGLRPLPRGAAKGRGPLLAGGGVARDAVGGNTAASAGWRKPAPTRPQPPGRSRGNPRGGVPRRRGRCRCRFRWGSFAPPAGCGREGAGFHEGRVPGGGRRRAEGRSALGRSGPAPPEREGKPAAGNRIGGNRRVARRGPGRRPPSHPSACGGPRQSLPGQAVGAAFSRRRWPGQRWPRDPLRLWVAECRRFSPGDAGHLAVVPGSVLSVIPRGS